MGIISRISATTGSGNVSDLMNPRYWLEEWGGHTTASGETVGAQSAMGLSAYYASIRNISEDLAKMPLNVYKRRSTRGQDVAHGHPTQRLLHYQPNPIMRSYNWRRLMVQWVLGWGNAYAEIVRDRRGVPTELWPIHPSRIKPEFDEKARELYYLWRKDGAASYTEILTDREIFHLQALGDGIEGWSVLRFARESVGRGLAAQKYGAAFFGEGASPKMIATVVSPMERDGRDGLRRRLGLDGSEPGQRKLPILEGDIKFHQWGISPEDAQYLETEEYSVEDVARWFRMALAKIQSHKRAQGWSTLEALNTDYANDALMPWARCFEEEVWAKLLDGREQDDHYAKFVMQGLQRGDYTTRMDGYSKRFANGSLSPNDIRDLEDENPIEDPAGDLYYIQSSFVPLAQAAKEPEPVPPQLGGRPVPPSEDEEPEEAPEDPDPEDAEVPEEAPEEADGAEEAARERAVAVLWPLALDVSRRLVAKERNALGRAARKHAANSVAYTAWANGFYERLSGEAREAVGAVQVAAAALGYDTGEASGDMAGRLFRPRDVASRLTLDEDVHVAHVAESLMAALLGPSVTWSVDHA